MTGGELVEFIRGNGLEESVVVMPLVPGWFSRREGRCQDVAGTDVGLFGYCYFYTREQVEAIYSEEERGKADFKPALYLGPKGG